MKITVYTLAWDTDYGTGAQVFVTEREAFLAMIDMALPDERKEAISRLDDEDFWDWFNDQRDPLDTYNVDEHTLEYTSESEVKYECQNLECGAVFSYSRICLGNQTQPNFCPLCGVEMTHEEA